MGADAHVVTGIIAEDQSTQGDDANHGNDAKSKVCDGRIVLWRARLVNVTIRVAIVATSAGLAQLESVEHVDSGYGEEVTGSEEEARMRRSQMVWGRYAEGE